MFGHTFSPIKKKKLGKRLSTSTTHRVFRHPYQLPVHCNFVLTFKPSNGRVRWMNTKRLQEIVLNLILRRKKFYLTKMYRSEYRNSWRTKYYSLSQMNQRTTIFRSHRQSRVLVSSSIGNYLLYIFINSCSTCTEKRSSDLQSWHRETTPNNIRRIS